MIEKRDKSTTETQKLYYNAENRLIKTEHYPSDVEPADMITTYTYDIYGRRLSKTVNGMETRFFWEGDNLAYEIDPITDEPIRRYLFENGQDDLQAHVEFDEVTDDDWFNYQKHGWYSYKKDQVGTIYQVYDHHDESYTESRTYDVFGKLVSKTGNSGCMFGFQSKYYDEESGLDYFYHRYYDPEVGRFINEDPVGFKGGLNLYGFVGGNPINFFDPIGKQSTRMPQGWLSEIYRNVYENMSPAEKLVKKMLEGDQCAVCLAGCLASGVLESLLIDIAFLVVAKKPPTQTIYRVLDIIIKIGSVYGYYEKCRDIDCRDVCCIRSW